MGTSTCYFGHSPKRRQLQIVGSSECRHREKTCVLDHVHVP